MSPRTRRPFVIGLTGPIAAGKSYVASVLAELGAEIIDADRVYGELIAPPSLLLDQIAAQFGTGVIHASGGLDRAALGAIVFNDAQALAELESLTHPAVIAEVRHRVDRSTADVVVNEAIRLVESGMAAEADALWLVDADPEVRMRRLMARNSLDEESARVRLAASRPALPDDLSIDEIIDNSGSLEETRAQVMRAWERLPIETAQTVPTGRTTRELT